MSGAGNDFMVIDARGLTLDFSDMAVKLCKLTGADGFMAIDHSDCADFRLHFYNSDGTRGEMCGNGARCICRYAYELGVAGENMVVQTDAGLVPGWRISENRYKVQLNDPTTLDLTRREDAAYVELGDPGIPHSVTEIPGLSWNDKDALREKAKLLRFAPEFPKGANVNFYTWLNENAIRILTYERGVEDYTLACGTGSGSTAAVIWALGKFPADSLTVENEGGSLKISITEEAGKITQLFLEGPAEVLEIYDL
jgi:diaminopimelate epimerase